MTTYINMPSGTLAKKANHILIKLAIISGALLGALIFAAIRYYYYAVLAANSLLGKVHEACGCQALTSFTDHPYIYSAIIALGVALAVPMAILLIKTASICWRTARFISQHLKNKKSALSSKLYAVATEINLQNKITEIANDEPVVFCYGFIKQRICVSSRIVNTLSTDELKTVLLHEQYHLQAHEPIKLLITKIAGQVFFFMPGMKSLARQYAVLSELAADEKATANFQHKGSLARALNKLILAWEKKMAAEKTLAISFFDNTMEERINKLTDDNYLPAARHSTKKILSGFLLIGILYLLGGQAARAFSLNTGFTSHGNCAMEISAAKNNCGAPNLWSKCAVGAHAPTETKDPCADRDYADYIK